MRIAEGIKILKISTNIMGKSDMIYPTLFWDEDNVILVDTGFPGQLQQFHEALDQEGFPFNKLNKIIITHQDIDHVGNLKAILTESTKPIEVIACKEETPYINGEKTPIKLAKLEAMIDILPEQMKKIYEGMKSFYNSSQVNIDLMLVDGEELPFCGGITVIHTPGHTPGHICLYHKQSKTLIAGDALSVENKMLIKAAAFTNYDDNQAIESLMKLIKYDIDTIICYHGGVYKGDIARDLAKLVDKQ
jgi:glyoxylase-like metal-dependent hydrolase (beta-lactamase superfamily II)